MASFVQLEPWFVLQAGSALAVIFTMTQTEAKSIVGVIWADWIPEHGPDGLY